MRIQIKFKHQYYICYLVKYNNRKTKQVEYHVNFTTKKIIRTSCSKINNNSVFFKELDIKTYPIKNLKYVLGGK